MNRLKAQSAAGDQTNVAIAVVNQESLLALCLVASYVAIVFQNNAGNKITIKRQIQP